MELAKAQLEEELENLKQGQIEADDLKAVKERILWELAQSYESNSSMAGLYIPLAQLRTSKPRTTKLDSSHPAGHPASGE